MKFITRVYLKIRMLIKARDCVSFHPAGNMKYAGTPKREAGTGIGPKDLLETGPDPQKQWLWFIALWCGGLGATAALAYGVRWFVFR